MSVQPSTYIVTGGAGFIGSNLVAKLLANEPGAMIYVVDDFSTGSYANIVEACQRAGVGPFMGSVLSDSVSDLNWQPALLGLEPKAVFHLAAITDTLEFDEKKMLSVNTEPFSDILEACAECDIPLVYASSAATYGSPACADDRVPFPIDAAGYPNNVYGFSKWMMDVEVMRFFAQRDQARESRPHVVGLRYFNVFGPGETRKGKMASMVLHLTNQILDGKNPKLFKMGEHQRDQVFVDDVVNCTIAGANRSAKPGIYNLGCGQTTSFNDIVDAINEALSTNVTPEYFDMPDQMVSTYQHYTCADMSKTKEGLGWSPAWSPIDAMIRYARMIATDRDQSRVGSIHSS